MTESDKTFSNVSHFKEKDCEDAVCIGATLKNMNEKRISKYFIFPITIMIK